MTQAKHKEEAVTGVLVDGVAGAKGSRSWEALLDLRPWAREDGTVQEGSLSVSIPVAYSRLAALQERLAQGTVVRVRIRGEQAVDGGVMAKGRFPVRKVRPSAQLLARRAELEKPVVLEHPLFASAHPRYVEKAAASLTRALGKTRERERALVDDLLELYNDIWREKGPALAARGFLSRIKLESATLYEDGSLTLYHRDGGLFRRHTIEVRVGKNGRVSEAILSG